MTKSATGQERIYLPTAGPLAGFPGASHGPGLVLLDWDARTVTPVQPAQEDVPPASEPETPPAQPEGVSEPTQPEAQPAPAEQIPPEGEAVTS